mgnify:CR=1 FL=1
MLKDLNRIMAAIKDERFITARHALQSLWKVATASKALQKIVVDRLSRRFQECTTEEHGTLIRYDIQEVFRKLYDVVQNEKLRQHARSLIETEEEGVAAVLIMQAVVPERAGERG